MIHLTAPVGFGTTKRLGFPLLVGIPLEPRVRLFLLDERAVLLTVKDDERVSGGKALCCAVPRKGNRVLMLQTRDLRVGQ